MQYCCLSHYTSIEVSVRDAPAQRKKCLKIERFKNLIPQEVSIVFHFQNYEYCLLNIV